MNETDVKDSRGNIIIAPGLKVRHSDSQYEYTVDQVVQEPNGEVTVVLASPETPRFEPATGEDVLSDIKKKNKVLYEAEPVTSLDTLFYVPDADEEPSEEDLLAVPSKEFEKEYEVK